MADTAVTKVGSRFSPHGPGGQEYLAASLHVGRRLWDEEPAADAKRTTRREYETVGYVIRGRAELLSEGQTVTLNPGDSWVVPRGAEHTDRVLEPFTAVDATYPPAHMHGRDEK
jgi:quercetin dioxygenase-like cupin family protein